MHRLKVDLDRLAAETAPGPNDIARALALAQEAQRQSIAWAISHALP